MITNNAIPDKAINRETETGRQGIEYILQIRGVQFILFHDGGIILHTIIDYITPILLSQYEKIHNELPPSYAWTK